MKNAMFQFYDGANVVEDTGLITVEMAMEKFESHKPAFAKALNNGDGPQMAIWSDCEGEFDYSNCFKSWDDCCVKYENGHFWVKE